MKDSEVKIGKSVRALSGPGKGLIGTVRWIDIDGRESSILVEFDEYKKDLHGGYYDKSHNGHCWFFKAQDLEPVDDREALLSRVEAMEKEIASLRQMASKSKKIVYNCRKLYIGIKDGHPYIMVEMPVYGKRFYRFLSFLPQGGSSGYVLPIEGAQACLDYHVEKGFNIHAFNTTLESFEFFLKNLK